MGTLVVSFSAVVTAADPSEAHAGQPTPATEPAEVRSERAPAPELAPPPDYRMRVSWGVIMGTGSGSLTVNDTDVARHTSTLSAVALEASVAQRMLGWDALALAIVGVGRVGTGGTSWTSNRGETATRVGVSVGPELQLCTRPRRPVVTWRLRLTGGAEWGWQSEGDSRAVREDYSVGRGFGLGAALIAELMGKRNGGFLQVSFLHRNLTFDHTAVLWADPEVRADERYRFSEWQLLLGGGYVLRFWE
jgi:hypothetical protein